METISSRWELVIKPRARSLGPDDLVTISFTKVVLKSMVMFTIGEEYTRGNLSHGRQRQVANNIAVKGSGNTSLCPDSMHLNYSVVRFKKKGHLIEKYMNMMYILLKLSRRCFLAYYSCTMPLLPPTGPWQLVPLIFSSNPYSLGHSVE